MQVKMKQHYEVVGGFTTASPQMLQYWLVLQGGVAGHCTAVCRPPTWYLPWHTADCSPRAANELAMGLQHNGCSSFAAMRGMIPSVKRA